MQKIRNFLGGGQHAFEGIKTFYQTPELWKYSAIPLLLILLTYTALVAAAWLLIKHLSGFFAEKCSDLPGFLQWLGMAASGASAIAVILIFSVIAVVSLGTLYELFGGLFFDALIQKFSVSYSPEMLKKSDWRFNIQAITDSIVYSFNTLLIILAVLVVNLFLPFIGQLIGIFIISYRFGVSYLAMCGFHYRRSMLQTRALAYKNFMFVLGYGASIYLVFLFPLAVVFTLPGLIIGGVKLYNLLVSN